MVHLFSPNELLQEHAAKQHTKEMEANFPKLKGMTARQKHEFALKQEKERMEKLRQERASQNFFCSSQATALATGTSTYNFSGLYCMDGHINKDALCVFCGLEC